MVDEELSVSAFDNMLIIYAIKVKEELMKKQNVIM